jgi:hypothetical protein
MPRFLDSFVDYYFGVNEMKIWTNASENNLRRYVSSLDWLGQACFTGLQWFYLTKEVPKMVAEENYTGAAFLAGIIVGSAEAGRNVIHHGIRLIGYVVEGLTPQ